MPNQKNFIKKYNLSDPVCLNKLAWSTVHLSVSETMSCHRIEGDPITPETYHNFHNTPSKIKDRKRMFSGKWPKTNGPNPSTPHSGCNVCREVEQAGGSSDRNLINNSIFYPNLVPKEIKRDSTSLITTPTILEVYFNNQCNLMCVYCSPKFSSAIAAEHRRNLEPSSFKEVNDVLDNKKTYSKLLEAHWAWMRENARYLKRYQILGGEPFYQKELEQNIDFFMENKCPNLEVVIFSNLKVEKEKFRKILNKLSFLIKNKHVKDIIIPCSFDCWGPQIEYLRHGLKLNDWEENFLILLNEYPDINIAVHSTLTALTFDTFPELCRKIKEWIKIRPIRHEISTVDARPFLHPGIFSNGFYAEKINESVEAYREIIDYIGSTNNNKFLINSYAEIIEQLTSYEKAFNSHDLDIKNIKRLKIFLDINDSRRKTNWKLLWPWLDQYSV